MHPSKKMIILVLGLGIFTGCAATPENDLNPPAGTNLPEAQTAVQTSAADQATLDSAVRQLDAALCDRLGTPELVGECRQSVGDQKLLSDAVSLNDKAICAKIAGSDVKQSCLQKLQEMSNAAEQKEQAEAALKGQYDTYTSLIDGGKVEDCAKSLQDAGFIANCEATITTNLAIAARDTAKCASIGDELGRQDCEKAVNAMK